MNDLGYHLDLLLISQHSLKGANASFKPDGEAARLKFGFANFQVCLLYNIMQFLDKNRRKPSLS